MLGFKEFSVELTYFKNFLLCRIDAFLRSDQNRCASRLLSAYRNGDVEEIKKICQTSTISHLDHAVKFCFARILFSIGNTLYINLSFRVDNVWLHHTLS